MVFSQFVQQVVDTCFRARPNSLDDANVDPPPSILSVHSASRREGATPFRRVIQQDLGTGQRHTISRRCRSVSAAIQTLVWSDREFVKHWSPEDGPFGTAALSLRRLIKVADLEARFIQLRTTDEPKCQKR